MGVAHTLARQFFWYENVLWREDLTDCQASVFLSANDAIVNAAVVREYLEGTDTPGNDVAVRKSVTTNGHRHKKDFPQDQDHKMPRVVWGDCLDHGQFFDIPVWRKRMRDEVLTLSRIGHRK